MLQLAFFPSPPPAPAGTRVCARINPFLRFFFRAVAGPAAAHKVANMGCEMHVGFTRGLPGTVIGGGAIPRGLRESGPGTGSGCTSQLGAHWLLAGDRRSLNISILC